MLWNRPTLHGENIFLAGTGFTFARLRGIQIRMKVAQWLRTKMRTERFIPKYWTE